MIILFILYYFSRTFVIYYLLINYILSIALYTKSLKYYFPFMSFKPTEIKQFETNRAANPSQYHYTTSSKKQYFHEYYPAFNRTELYSVSFIRVYWGMINYVWLKFFGSLLSMVMVYLYLRIFFFIRGGDKNITKESKGRLSWMLYYLVKLVYLSAGVKISEKNLCKDKNKSEETFNVYKKYLGKDYQPGEEFSSVISNHVSWVDILYLLSKNGSSFIGKDSIQKVPLVGYISQRVNSLFIDRSNKENKQVIFDQIGERQKQVAEGKNFFPLIIYPEGTTNNGRSITMFKKGAFHALLPLKMFIMKIPVEHRGFYIASAGMNAVIHVFLSFTFLYNKMEAWELPVIKPTEFMFEKYAHLGKDKVEVYLEVCRRIMSEISSLPLSSQGFVDKLNYISDMKRKVVTNT